MTEGRGRGRGEWKMGDGAKVILFASVGLFSSTLKSPTPELRRGLFKKVLSPVRVNKVL